MTTAKQTLRAMDKQIAQLKQERDDLEREMRKTSRQCIDATPPVYSYEVFVTDPDDHWLKPNSIRIQRTLENVEDYVKIIDKWGHPTFNGFEAEDKRKVLSVAYKRNEYGVLVHGHGGWLLLKEGMPVSDEDWALLQAGDAETIVKFLA